MEIEILFHYFIKYLVMRKLLLLVICFFLTGCVYLIPYRSIKKGFDCYEGKSTNLHSLINIQGYYYYNDVEKYGNKTFEQQNVIIFFEDGTWCFTVGDYRWLTGENGKKSINTFFKKVVDEPNSKCAKYFYGIRNWWGIYTIREDTIIAQETSNTSTFTPVFDSFVKMFKIVDCNTLIELYFSSIGDNFPTMVISEKNENSFEKNKKYHFIPTDTLPSSNNLWLKKKKWFWCNEEDWKDYMKKIKQK